MLILETFMGHIFHMTTPRDQDVQTESQSTAQSIPHDNVMIVSSYSHIEIVTYKTSTV